MDEFAEFADRTVREFAFGGAQDGAAAHWSKSRTQRPHVRQWWALCTQTDTSQLSGTVRSGAGVGRHTQHLTQQEPSCACG